MSEITFRRSLPKRIFIFLGGLVAFILVFTFACRLAVVEIFRGIETSRATGLSASSWDLRSTWSSSEYAIDFATPTQRVSQISRNAELRALTPSFDRSVTRLHQVVSARGGYLEDLRTESRSTRARMLSALISMPSSEFDSALAELKRIGRIDAISETGEDSAVKLASSARHMEGAQTNLARLQKLQREHRGVLRDALALEKEIAQANETVAEAHRQQEALLSTVAQAHIRFTLMEEYRAVLDTNLSGVFLQLRNSLVEGAGAVFSSVAIFLAVLLEYGLPLLFWATILIWPARLGWRRFRSRSSAPIGVA